jgi:UDP-N-acetylmuramoyl-tripeptide--D-alanyl-D-alanine ligase
MYQKMNNLLFSLKEIENITEGKWFNYNEEIVINDFIHIISQVKKEDVFIVHYSNWYDKNSDNEHDIPKAIKQGASALIVQKQTNIEHLTIPVLVVEDTYYALRKLALFASGKSNAKRVLITGSYGKTGFKNHLYHLISDKLNTYVRLHSSNKVASTYGNLASLKKDTDTLIIEIPISSKNKTQKRAKYVKPDICLITSIGHEHIDKHKTIEKIVERKCSIANALGKNGKIIIPADSKYYNLIRNELNQYKDINILTFGTNSSCNAQLLSADYEDYKYKVKALIEGIYIEYFVPFIDEYAPLVSTAELLCGKLLGLDVLECARKYKNLTNFKSSGKIYKLEYNNKSFLLLDYNKRGGIEGYRSFFKTLQNIQASENGRKILFTSEFVDIQDGEEKFVDTDEFRNLINQCSFEKIYSVENFKKVHENLIEDKTKWIKHYDNVKDLLKEEFLDTVQNGDVICIKSIFESDLYLFSKLILSKSKKIEF